MLLTDHPDTAALSAKRRRSGRVVTLISEAMGGGCEVTARTRMDALALVHDDVLLHGADDRRQEVGLADKVCQEAVAGPVVEVSWPPDLHYLDRS
ncbi:hypothetical protein ACVWW4_000071 [Bradyrhizobium sp. LB7.1]